MSCAGCRETLSHSRVKVEEGARKAIFKNESRESYHKTRVDGCLVKNAIAADFVVSKTGVGDVIVELKGGDVNRGAQQVLETARFMRACNNMRGPVAGLIVCSQFPRISTVFQRMKIQFMREFQGPLHAVTREREFIFDRVLSSSGPE